ncbi:molybdenum cofactor guanylyltransferase, partial [bacterium]|nr:molybdenum cofactor guanylyltransferase [bacterium]
KSSRFGSDKMVYKINGNFLIMHPLSILRDCFSKIYISSNSDRYSEYNYPIINDIYPDSGPLGAIYSILNQINTDYLFVVAGDMPSITEDFITPLLKTELLKYDTVLYKTPDGVEPLFGWYHKNLISRLKESLENRDLSMKKFIYSIENSYFIKTNHRGVFQNINRLMDI